MGALSLLPRWPTFIRVDEFVSKSVSVDKNGSTGRIIGVLVGEEITCFYSIPMVGSTIRQLFYNIFAFPLFSVASDYVLLALITATDADHHSPQWCRMVTHLADTQVDKTTSQDVYIKIPSVRVCILNVVKIPLVYLKPRLFCCRLHHTPLFHYWNFSTRWIRYNGETLIEEMKCMGYPHRICPRTESPSFGTIHSALYIHGDVP